VPNLAPHKEEGRRVWDLSGGGDQLRRGQKPRRTWQFRRPRSTVRGRESGDAFDRALGDITLDRRQAEDALRAEPDAECVDEASDIDIASLWGDMPPNGLALGKGLHPGGGKRRLFDAEAGIDEDEALGQELAKMLAIAVWPRGADPHSLRNVINPQEHQIKPPRADPPHFQFAHQRGTELFNHSLQVFGIEERLDEF